MSLSCECGDGYPEPGDTYINDVRDYKPTPMIGCYRRRCKNCKNQIPKGALAAEVTRVKVPETDVEVKIHGEDGEIRRTSWWLCERCADIFFSLDELGFCFPIDEIDNALAEYHDNYQRPQEKVA